MCFSGGNSNQSAFFWGSIFMIVVPVSVLGTLGYLALRRIRIVDERNARGLAPRRVGVSASSVEHAEPASSSQPIKQT